MNNLEILSLKILRKLFRERNFSKKNKRGDMEGDVDFRRCQYFDQKGNDYILQRLNEYKGGGLMLSKWGTLELATAVSTYFSFNKKTLRDYISCIRGLYELWPSDSINHALYTNAGVFPDTLEIKHRFGMQALEDCRQIDILASYIKAEKVIESLMANATNVNLDAFYAPFMWERPWTKWLEGKRVLVIHPFIESISSQYHQNREKLFTNPDVLPQFKELICFKAVQSIGGNHPSQFKDWFEALNYMKQEINKINYDVAIIGCGAYGMSLAAHIKRQGKVALHLAGWTQMLFGVYGKRWTDHQPKYSTFINQYWIRPNQNETVANIKSIEDGCYW